MSEKATYHNAISKKRLFTLSLVFILFAFPGLVNTAEACRNQPQRIEVIADGQEIAEPTYFLYQITDSKFSANSFYTTREYECNVQLTYHRQVKEALNRNFIQSYSYSPPNVFWIAKLISSPHDEAPHLTLG